MRFRSLYCLIAAGAGAAFGAAPAQPRVADTLAARVVACVACHGKEGRATSDGYYPRIAGKPAGYLYNQLLNFREGRRRNPAMAYLVDNLPDAYLREIAGHFAAQNVPYPRPQTVNAPRPVLERGRQLVMSGDKSTDIPACVACHGQSLTGVAPSIPGLLGLPRDYLNAQFGAWKIGDRHAAAPDCMAQIARRINADDISAAAAYLASMPVPANAAPASKAEITMPMKCGSTAPDPRAP
jgi:cytochrome c553